MVTAGMTSCVRVRRAEREHAEGDGTAARAGRPSSSRSMAASAPAHLGHRDPRRHAPSGQPDAVAHEQESVAAGEAVEVDLAVERSGDGPHAHGLTPGSP